MTRRSAGTEIVQENSLLVVLILDHCVWKTSIASPFSYRLWTGAVRVRKVAVFRVENSISVECIHVHFVQCIE